MRYSRIRDLREDNDLTQREMGEILCCSQRVYSNYERGDLDIPTEILIKLAKYYHTSTDYILRLYLGSDKPLKPKASLVRPRAKQGKFPHILITFQSRQVTNR